MALLNYNAYPVIVVDDEPDNLEVFKLNLKREFDVRTAKSGAEALALMKACDPGVIVTDQRMPGMSGIELLKETKKARPDCVRMIITAYSDSDVLLKAINEAQIERYIPKPFRVEDVRNALRQGLERFHLERENRRLFEELRAHNAYLEEEVRHGEKYDWARVKGSQGGLKVVVDEVEKVAPTRSTVLLRGETGTGKEVVARAIHESSPRRGKPLIKVNCAALPDTLLESELFGHEKGAFTGAEKRRLGRFELADTGTIFLDEIGDVTPAMQAKLLRVLQEREFERVGGNETVKVDVRVVAATHKNLEEAVKKGTFREDLYFRLNVFPIELPPLRKRRDDIPELARFFLTRFAGEAGKGHLQTFSADATARLVAYPWPGNVRELENVIERAVILANGEILDAQDLRFLDAQLLAKTPGSGGAPTELPTKPSGEQPLPEVLERLERDELIRAMDTAQGSKAKAARSLGVNRSTLYYRLRKHGLAERYGLPPVEGGGDADDESSEG
jgi:Nif-specific regulatory protein